MISRDTDVETSLNYDLTVANGGSKDFYPGTASNYLRKRAATNVVISDVRGQEKNFTLDQHGFEFHEHTSMEKAFTNDEEVKGVVYDEIVDLLKEKTGATRVVPFSHMVRKQPFEKAVDIAKTVDPTHNLGFIVPARFVHVDQSYAGAQEIFQDNMIDDMDRLGTTRWGIINVWRPIAPIRREPFAVCDASTVDDSDLVGKRANLSKKDKSSFQNVSRGQGFETWGVYPNPNHRWYYQSDMTPEEVMFVKCYDSKKDGRARRAPHSSFVNPKTKDDPKPRESIEVRCLVFWEDQDLE